MFLAKVYITLKESVLDPQGQTVKRSLESMGEKEIEDVRIGKYIELKIKADNLNAAKEDAKRIIEKLLVNPVIESYSYDVEEAV